MEPIDDRIAAAADSLRNHVARHGDTDAAWSAHVTRAQRGPGGPVPPRRWVRWVTVGVAAAFVVAAVVAILINRDDRRELEPAVTSSTVATSPPSTSSGSTVPESTAVASTAPGTTAATTSSPSSTATATAEPVTTSAPTTVAAPTTAAPPTTVVVPAGLTLPKGASIVSASFPTPTNGWAVVNRVQPQADGSTTTQLLSTTDRGATWTEHTLDGRPTSVVFADTTNGWVVAEAGLRSTHDGGQTWKAVSVGDPGQVYAVAADASMVHVVGFSAADTAFAVFTSPVGQDAFVASASRIQPGAGPRADFQMLLRGANGWVVYNDRTVTGGGRPGGGAWQAWNPPCLDSPESGSLYVAALAASPSGRQLVAVCGPSPFAGAEIPGKILVSTDAGSTFTPVAALPPNFSGQFGESFRVVAPSDTTIGLLFKVPSQPSAQFAVTNDGGATWTTTTEPSSDGQYGEPFTVPGGPVVLPLQGGPAIVSDDAGATWRLESPQ